jgi:hypothetical protein
MHTLRATFLGLLAAGTILAADPTGKWEATSETPRGEMKMTFNLKADGETLTGTIGNERMGESEIQDGKISGDDITFKQVMERGDRTMTIEWAGKISGDEIQFTRKFAGMPGGGPGGRPRAEGEGGRERGPRAEGEGGGRGPGMGGMTLTAKRVR